MLLFRHLGPNENQGGMDADLFKVKPRCFPPEKPYPNLFPLAYFHKKPVSEIIQAEPWGAGGESRGEGGSRWLPAAAARAGGPGTGGGTPANPRTIG